MTGSIVIQNGGTVYFHTAPYFAGETGTYLLDMTINRTQTLGIDEMAFSNLIKVYPNPAKDFIMVDRNEFKGDLNQIDLIDIQGQNVFNINTKSDVSNTFSLPLNNLAEGVYLLQLKTNSGILNRKIIISK